MKKLKFCDLYTKEDLQAMWLTKTQDQISQETRYSTRQIYRHTKKWGLEKRVRGRSVPWYILDVLTGIFL